MAMLRPNHVEHPADGHVESETCITPCGWPCWDRNM